MDDLRKSLEQLVGLSVYSNLPISAAWPLAIRAALVFLVLFISVRIVVGVVGFLSKLLIAASDKMLCYFGRGWDDIAGPDDITTFAPVFVQVESILHRLNLAGQFCYEPEFPIEAETASETPQEEASEAESTSMTETEKRQLIEGSSASGRASGIVLTFVRVASTLIFSLGLAPTIALFEGAVWLWRHKMTLVISALGAVWYAGKSASLLGAMSAVSNVLNLTVPVLLATGTLVTLVYAALNSDVRGRAEVNKAASVACRTSMLQALPCLRAIGEHLTVAGYQASVHAKLFPTAANISAFAQREDLLWRGISLVPKDAKGRLSDDLFEPIVLPGPKADEILRTQAEEPHADPGEALVTLESIFEQLRTSAYYSKLDRVVGRIGVGYLEELGRHRFGLDDVCRRSSTPWWEDRHVPSPTHELREEFERLKNADPNSPELRKACQELHMLIRRTRSNMWRTRWQTAVNEARVNWLVRHVDSSLRPKTWERVRQFFGK